MVDMLGAWMTHFIHHRRHPAALKLWVFWYSIYLAEPGNPPSVKFLGILKISHLEFYTSVYYVKIMFFLIYFSMNSSKHWVTELWYPNNGNTVRGNKRCSRRFTRSDITPSTVNPLCVKSGALSAHCWGLALVDFGRNPSLH